MGLGAGIWVAALMLAMAGFTGAQGQTVGATRVVFGNSIKAVPMDNTVSTAAVTMPQTRTKAAVTRTALTAEELAAPMGFQVSLKMRNLAELQARVNQGEVISREEMAEKYDKTPYQVALNWLISQTSVVTIPKTTKVTHLEENLGAFGWELSPEDMERLRIEYPDQQLTSERVPLDYAADVPA